MVKTMKLNEDQKQKIELATSLLGLLKPYLSPEDEKTYRKIMSDEFKFLFNVKGELHSDE